MGLKQSFFYYLTKFIMSTRATITVSNNDDAFHIYVHWYWYPEIVIPLIEKALNFAWDFPRYEAWDFATAIIRVMKTRAGGIYLTKDAELHSDRDFHYEVTELLWNLSIKVTPFK